MTTTMTTSHPLESEIPEVPTDRDPIVLEEWGESTAFALPGAAGHDSPSATTVMDRATGHDAPAVVRPSRRSAPLGLIGEQVPLTTGPRPPEFIPRTASVLADALGIERPSVVLSRESMARAGDHGTESAARGETPTPPATPPLGQVLTRLRLRPVPEGRAATLDPRIVTGSLEAGYREAVWMAVPTDDGEGRWVTTADLDVWMVDADMILDVCRGHAQDVASPPVSIVLDPAGRQILVLESDTPDAVALLPHLGRLMRLAPGAEALVALANDHVILVHTDGGRTADDMAGILLSAAEREHARRPGLSTPALYRWSEGHPELISSRLDTAAGRLIANLSPLGSRP